MALVSVVTPFYNTAEYLEECIGSVRAQTFGDFEYILLDNCSTDGGREIAERHAREDPRIRVHSNTRLLPQVENYNHALTLISPSSRYCKVVQADDFIFPQCLSAMVALAEKNPGVALVGAYGLFGRDVYLDGIDLRETVIPGGDLCRRYLRDGLFVFGSPNSVMMRSDLVRARQPFYVLDSPFEDVEVCLDLLNGTDFGFVHQVLTFTRRENTSIFTGIRSYDPLLLCRLICLARHGRNFFEAREYEPLLRAAERDVYEYLGGAWWTRRSESKLWSFYREGMVCAGLPLSKARLRLHILAAALRLALNPLATTSAALRRFNSGRP
jgi:glycosyltransferase involved in cell wall biosynthesis